MKVVILHGTVGSPESNWFQWLKQKLETSGHRVFVPRLPTPENQSAASWNAAFKEQVLQLEKDTVLIGHSCGATYLLHVLESLKQPVAQSILVSGFIDYLGNDYFDKLNETFVNHEFDWERIKRNAGKVTLFYGDNDPYVPPAAAKSLADKLETPLTIIPGGGHLNAEFGFTEFAPILTLF